jgi:hypothetical protein
MTPCRHFSYFDQNPILADSSSYPDDNDLHPVQSKQRQPKTLLSYSFVWNSVLILRQNETGRFQGRKDFRKHSTETEQ